MGDIVWYWSDRPESDRKALYSWLYKQGLLSWMDRFSWWRSPNKLRLRPEGNLVSEATLKFCYLESLHRYQYSSIFALYDDSDEVISLFHRAGFTAIDSSHV